MHRRSGCGGRPGYEAKERSAGHGLGWRRPQGAPALAAVAADAGQAGGAAEVCVERCGVGFGPPGGFREEAASEGGGKAAPVVRRARQHMLTWAAAVAEQSQNMWSTVPAAATQAKHAQESQ